MSIDKGFIPYRDRDVLKWRAGKNFVDFKTNLVFGTFVNLIKKCETCEIDLSSIEWANPLSLLYLSTVLTQTNNKNNITINLGNAGNSNHKKFLKFATDQGFIKCLAQASQIKWQGDIIEEKEIVKNINEIQVPLTYQNTKCVTAKVIDFALLVQEGKEDEFQKTIEELIDEANINASYGRFGTDPIYQDIILQKLRKIFYELLLNIGEHAYEDNTPAYGGVFVRVMDKEKASEDNSIIWHNRHNPIVNIDWLEIYICDAGKGLTHNIENWHCPEDDRAGCKALIQAKKAKNPLASIVDFIFRSAYSSQNRGDVNRGSITGLQHLFHVLQHGKDYGLLYDNGDAIGGEFAAAVAGSRQYNEYRQAKYEEYDLAKGTIYCFLIQPQAHDVYFDSNEWYFLESKKLSEIVEHMRSNSSYDAAFKSDVKVFDRRIKDHCFKPNPEQIKETSILRPPRLLAKRDLNIWVEELSENNCKTWIIVELTPFQSLYIAEFFKSFDREEINLEKIILISEKWQISAFRINTLGKATINQDIIASMEKNNTVHINIFDISVLLRIEDSKIFWDQEHGGKFLYQGDIDWDGTTLTHYLDFPHAIANPHRYKACRRALRRCLFLMQDYKPITTDSLLDTIIEDIERWSNRDVNLTSKGDVLIGSVIVTGSTIKKVLDGSTNKDMELIYLFSNGMDSTNYLNALLWFDKIEVDANSITEKLEGKDWQRIENTPFIAQYGQKSISLIRYPKKDGEIDFTQSFYERTPEQMYHDFKKSNIMKLGHWQYGSRHDLLTINTQHAFQSSLIENGELYNWLKNTILQLFTQPSQITPKISFLVYPSHSTTDAIINSLLVIDEFSNLANKIIPIKFLGEQTVSPKLISPLVREHIQTLLNDVEGAWNAAILDDGIISGKNLREIDQFLRSLGGKRIQRIVLVNRSGLPSHEEFFSSEADTQTRYQDQEKVFWRWDIPTLGYAKNCIICKSLANIENFKHSNLRQEEADQLDSWKNVWQTRNVTKDWHVKDYQIDNIKFDQEAQVTFGVDPENRERRKSISFYNSTYLNSVLMELAQLTTRNDVAFSKASNFSIQENEIVKNPEKAKDVALEIICTQLLLFYDELSKSDKIKRYEKIIDCLLSKKTKSDFTSLAGITIAIIDSNIIKNISDYGITEYDKKVNITNISIDTSLALQILFTNANIEIGCQTPKIQSLMRRSSEKRALYSYLSVVEVSPDNNLLSHDTKLKNELTKLGQIRSANLVNELSTY